MYGLLIESLADYLILTYGDEAWEEIRKRAELTVNSFSTQQVYSESMLPTIVSCASKLLNLDERLLMESLGVHFVKFVSRFGYDRMLAVLGRHLRDFLNGLDNLHEYFRFSYPRMMPPSFFCDDEDKDGLTLHYRTRRRGYVHYTIGQIKAVGEMFYQTPVKIDIVLEEMQMNVFHVVMKLNFDNTGYDEDAVEILKEENFLPVPAQVVFDLFPFAVVFTSNLEICVLGCSLHNIMADALGRNVNEVFSLVRPALDFTWNAILSRPNNVFELSSIEPIKINESDDDRLPAANKINSFNDQVKEQCLQLKGQMLFVTEWDAVIYLGTPVMQDLDAMISVGLYINDLSMHDFSRDLMLAGTQQSVELKLALDQEQKKSKRLEDSMRKLDDEMRRTDELLYQMIPKEVANRLRKGECSVATCETFDNVTILFSDVVTFTEMCSRITPMQVVTLLNMMYSLFDNLTERHDVYKVETIGDAYMVVAGCPQRVDDHAIRICNMAMDMTNVITGIKDPSTNKNLRIRVGIHSGNVVAGVVGVKMPRYCLFGDAVNTTSRMESSSEAMKIQISTETKNLLPPEFKVELRGTVSLKGKGRVKTFWLVGKDGYVPPAIGLEGAGGISASGSSHYSPVMMSENILDRDSIAYSVLSNFSPTVSRPQTAASIRGSFEENKMTIPAIAVTSISDVVELLNQTTTAPPTTMTSLSQMTSTAPQTTSITSSSVAPRVVPPTSSVARSEESSKLTSAVTIKSAATNLANTLGVNSINKSTTSSVAAVTKAAKLPSGENPAQDVVPQIAPQVAPQVTQIESTTQVIAPQRVLPVARKQSRDFEAISVPVQKLLKPQFDVQQTVPAIHCNFQCQSSACNMQ